MNYDFLLKFISKNNEIIEKRFNFGEIEYFFNDILLTFGEIGPKIKLLIRDNTEGLTIKADTTPTENYKLQELLEKYLRIKENKKSNRIKEKILQKMNKMLEEF